MAKKDISIQEDIKREREEKAPETEETGKKIEYTEVKNASASGMGSMGRNNEEPYSKVKKED
jgi:hypothetical protein